MLKNKNFRASLIAVVIFSMIAMYGFIPTVKAESLSAVKDTISDSDVGATNVTHTINFTTGRAVIDTGYIEITFAAEFANILTGGVTCPASTTVVAVAGQVVRCNVDVGETLAPGPYVVTVTDVTNPSPTAGAYTLNIATKDVNDQEIEGMDIKVYIIQDVLVTAHVDSTLTFTITGLPASTDVNGVLTTEETNATNTPFGTLTDTSSSTVGQQLEVTTNASDGFTVTVFQDGNMTSAGAAEIDAFKNGTPPVAPEGWSPPVPDIDDNATWGHLGLTSEDDDIPGFNFGDRLYTGFTGTTPIPVMYHNGPADGAEPGKGMTQVAYTAETSAMQEAGDYSNTLTYICTPQY
jgi:hypothetical protein